MTEVRYPIRAVSKLTGLSIDTLRAWERRYEAVSPRRDGRGRIYTQEDIQRLQMLRAAVEAGHAIGRVAELTDLQLKELLTSTAQVADPGFSIPVTKPETAAIDLSQILKSVDRFDDSFVDRELGRLAALLSPRDLVRKVALPLLQRIGEGWRDGHLSVAQEHLISALLRNLLGTLVRVSSRPITTVRMLFSTPSGELHEFGVMSAALLAAAGGLGVTYLGPNLPPEEIIEAAKRIGSNVIVLGVTGSGGLKQAVTNIGKVASNLPPRVELWIGGSNAEALVQSIRRTPAIYLETFDHFEQQLTRLGARL